jgi:hypothetical protein
MTIRQIEANIEAINEFLRVNYSPLMSDENFRMLINERREYVAQLRAARAAK